jgi:hypothetical protein
MIDTQLNFGNNIVLSDSVMTNACNKVLEVIENELPDEAHSHEIYDYVIDMCKEVLKTKKVIL